MASAKFVIIGASTDLSPVRCQTITSPKPTYYQLDKHEWSLKYTVSSDNAFKNVDGKWRQGALLLTRINSISAWINNHMPCKVWDEPTGPFTNFNSTVEVWEWISKFIPHFMIDAITYPRPPGLWSNHGSKTGASLLRRQWVNLDVIPYFPVHLHPDYW